MCLVVRKAIADALSSFDSLRDTVSLALWAHVANELHRTQNHLLLLNKGALERVVTFLLEMDDRPPPHFLALPTSLLRYD